MKTEPLVSVIIPMYNREKYIVEAINSVLSQSMQDFEIIIVDDGSEDTSVETVESISDRRLILYQNKRNLGIPETRNIGLSLAKGKYIANLDSDDMMKSSRLAKQVAFMENNPECVGVGSWSNNIDEQGSVIKYLRTRPISHEAIKASLLFHCCIHNRTFMAKASIIKKLKYDDSYDVGEDYDLLIRMLDYGNLHNIPRILVSAREHDEKITRHKFEQNNNKKKYLSSIFLDKLGLTYTDEDLDYHIKIGRLRSQYLEYMDEEFFYWSELWLERILRANASACIFNQKNLTLITLKMWLNILYRFKGGKVKHARIFGSRINKTLMHEILN